jgi:stage II sporulation protein AA (anti-sigma F factor antagonist)
VFPSNYCSSPAGRGYAPAVTVLDITVEAGEGGPVVRLSGEADVSVATRLSDALSAQVSGGARHMTVDLSGLRFADSASIQVLVEAHLALKRRGGTLVLANPQPLVTRTLVLLGIDQVIPVRPHPDRGPAGNALLVHATRRSGESTRAARVTGPYG